MGLRFLSDHDFRESILRGVLRREPTVEITRLRDVELERLPDEQVLEYAASQALILLTHDENTMIAAAYGRVAAGLPMAGVFVSHQDDPVGPIIEGLLLLWGASEMEEWRDRVIYVPV